MVAGFAASIDAAVGAMLSGVAGTTVVVVSMQLIVATTNGLVRIAVAINVSAASATILVATLADTSFDGREHLVGNISILFNSNPFVGSRFGSIQFWFYMWC